MKDYIKEKDLKDHANSVDVKKLEVIIEQMKKNICDIKCSINGHGTGFFCRIPFPDEWTLLPALLTNNHVLNEDDIKIGNKIRFSLNNNEKNFEIYIDKERKAYTSELYDITIIELKRNDGLKPNQFFDIDDNAFNCDDPHREYKEKDIYIIGNVKEYNMGKIKRIYEDKFNIEHNCPTKPGVSGSPIINLTNFKIIGIHKGSHSKKEFNLGTFIGEPIKDFIEKSLSQKEKQIIEEYTNEITIRYEVGEEKRIPIFGTLFVVKNKELCKMEVNGKEMEICDKFDTKNVELKDNILEIKLKDINNITDMSYLFYNCKTLIALPDISKWNTGKITDMSYIFSACEKLIPFPYISTWNTSNVTDIKYMFIACEELDDLPDISKWNTSKVTDMSYMFGHTDLTYLPNIS